MPAGSLLDGDFEFEIRTTLFGRGNGGVHIATDGIDGLGAPDPKTSDVDLWGQPGAEGNPEYDGVRVITIPVVILGASPSAVMSSLATLRTKWASSTTDIVLAIQYPGAKFTVTGRPRGMHADLKGVRFAKAEALLRFDALIPTMTAI